MGATRVSSLFSGVLLKGSFLRAPKVGFSSSCFCLGSTTSFLALELYDDGCAGGGGGGGREAFSWY